MKSLCFQFRDGRNAISTQIADNETGPRVGEVIEVTPNADEPHTTTDYEVADVYRRLVLMGEDVRGQPVAELQHVIVLERRAPRRAPATGPGRRK